MPVFLLGDDPVFPPPHLASAEGLLAVGGDLTTERLLLAYRKGIFPWYAEGDPILWWSPDPRLVLYPQDMHVSKRLKRTIKKGRFRVTFDRAFDQVISSCAACRNHKREGTWILPEMIAAYQRLHELGYAHSVESWHRGRLAGGLYGVSLGKCFFGESMFTHITDASKVGFVTLVNHLQSLSFDLIDCQVNTAHLVRFGAREVPRSVFLSQLKTSLKAETCRGSWAHCTDSV